MKTTLAAAGLMAGIILAYANALHAPFVFDDIQSIAENPSIRRLASASAWSPPAGVTVSGRPVVNVSLAANYAVGRTVVTGYHLVNLAIHAVAALVLFGLLCRTLPSPKSHARPTADATVLAFAAALLWALHPLQTESVTYVVQRAESLCGLFYLLTLYCFARSLASPRTANWQLACIAASALGMATKEVMVTVPIAVLLFDRAFAADSLRDAWRRRRRLYLGLFSTWLVLAFLAWQSGDRSGTAGFATGAAPWGYALTQSRAIVHYLGLAAWPYPLVFDYGEYTPPDVIAILPFAALLAAAIAGAIWLWRRRPAAGFAAVAFFLVLAPTSSVLPVFTEPVAEHRMYLPLAAVVALAAIALHRLLGRRSVAALLGLALTAGVVTARRNRDYSSERDLWEATVTAMPQNARAQDSLAAVLAARHEPSAAERHFQTAIDLRPDYLKARLGLAALLLDEGRTGEAEALYLEIVRSRPADFAAQSALGMIHFGAGKLSEARKDFEAALRADPTSPVAHNNLGCVLYEQGDFRAAQGHEETALRLKPDYAEAHYNLILAMPCSGRGACPTPAMPTGMRSRSFPTMPRRTRTSASRSRIWATRVAR